MLVGLTMLSRFWLTLGVAVLIAGISGGTLTPAVCGALAIVFLFPFVLLHWLHMKSK